MAKHAVPKRKVSKARTSRRYHAFERSAQIKLQNQVQLVTCDNCGQKRVTHHACPNCGMYRGRQVFNIAKETAKITKVKA